MVDLIFGSEAHPLQLLPITQQLTVGGIIAIPELAHFPKNLLLSLPDFVILLKPHSRFQNSTNFQVTQAIETANAIQYAGQNVTLSFYAAASASVTLSAIVHYSTATDVAPVVVGLLLLRQQIIL
jgi:hypothetical protein